MRTVSFIMSNSQVIACPDWPRVQQDRGCQPGGGARSSRTPLPTRAQLELQIRQQLTIIKCDFTNQTEFVKSLYVEGDLVEPPILLQPQVNHPGPLLLHGPPAPATWV